MEKGPKVTAEKITASKHLITTKPLSHKHLFEWHHTKQSGVWALTHSKVVA